MSVLFLVGVKLPRPVLTLDHARLKAFQWTTYLHWLQVEMDLNREHKALVSQLVFISTQVFEVKLLSFSLGIFLL